MVRMLPLRARQFAAVLGSAALFLGAGCTTTIQKPADAGAEETTLFVTRAGETAQLQWQSTPGHYYTVLFAETFTGSAKWQPLAGASRIKGTGGLLTWEDQVPAGRERNYRLFVEQETGKR